MTAKAEHLRRIADLLKGQWERAARECRQTPDVVARNDLEAMEIAWRLAEVDWLDAGGEEKA